MSQSIPASIPASITIPATYVHVAPDPDVMETFLASLAAARANVLDWCVPPPTSPPASPVARIYVPPPARSSKKRQAAPKHTTNAKSWKQLQAASNGGQACVQFQAFEFGKDRQVVGRLQPPITGNSRTDLVLGLVYDAMISGVDTTAKVVWTTASADGEEEDHPAASADGDEEEDHPAASADGDEEEGYPASWDEIEDPRAPEARDPCG